MDSGIVIDGHAHACGEYLTPEGIERKLKNAGTDMVLLTPGQYGSKITYGIRNLAVRNPLGDVVSKNNRTTSLMISLIGAVKQIPKGNEYVFQLKCSLPERVKQCYWVTRENREELQNDYERMHFDTIKFHQCWEKFDLENDFFVTGVEWAVSNKLPVFVHVRNLTQMKKLIEFIRRHPEAIIIIGHLYGLELFLEEDQQLFENVYFDLSNSYFVSRERIMLSYHHFGAKHLLLGSDTPYGKRALENTIELISELPILQSDKEQILGQNMAELLGV